MKSSFIMLLLLLFFSGCISPEERVKLNSIQTFVGDVPDGYELIGSVHFRPKDQLFGANTIESWSWTLKQIALDKYLDSDVNAIGKIREIEHAHTVTCNVYKIKSR